MARKSAPAQGPRNEVPPTPSRRQHRDRRRVQRRAPGEQRRLIPSRPHGEKFAYVKVTVTLPPELYELIIKETTKRKVAKEPEPAGVCGSTGGPSPIFRARCVTQLLRVRLSAGRGGRYVRADDHSVHLRMNVDPARSQQPLRLLRAAAAPMRTISIDGCAGAAGSWPAVALCRVGSRTSAMRSICLPGAIRGTLAPDS